MAVPMVSSAKAITFGGSKRSVASFCLAGVALPDILTCLQTCRTSFCVAGALLWRHFQKLSCSFRGRRSTLETSIVILRGRHSAWEVSCCVLFENRNVRAASSGDNVQIPWQACRFVTCDDTPHLHSTLYTAHSTLYTQHTTLYTPHSLIYTSHSTLYTLHSTLYTPHFTIHTSHFTLHTLHFTLHTLRFPVYTPHCTLCTPHTTLHTPHCTLHTLHSTLYTLHFTLHTPHSLIYTSHSTLCTSHSTLYTPHFTLHTFHSTLYTFQPTLHTVHFALLTPHSTLYTLHSTVYTLHSTLPTSHSTLYTPHSSLYIFHPTPYALHSTVRNPHFTLYTLHSPLIISFSSHPILCTPPSSRFHSLQCTGTVLGAKKYKTVQITCFTNVFYVTAFGFTGCIDCVFAPQFFSWYSHDFPIFLSYIFFPLKPPFFMEFPWFSIFQMIFPKEATSRRSCLLRGWSFCHRGFLRKSPRHLDSWGRTKD